MAHADIPRVASAAIGEARSRFRDTIRSLRYRNFQLFFSGQLISLIGTWMQNVAQAWLVYRMTGSSLLLGVVSFAGQIPVFPLAPLAGMVADRLNRRKVVIATQTASMILALILAFLTLTGRVTVLDVIVLAACMGVVNSFDIPARQSFLVEMVGIEDLMNAIALNSSMFNGARIIGPAIAGILVASIGEGWCFFVNGVSFIAVIVGLFMMRMPHRQREREAVSALEHIAEGFRFVRKTAPIRALLLLLGLVSLVAMPYTVLMPIFAAQVLHGNARTLGVLGAATGIGALAGALVLASRTRVHGLGTWVAIACGASGTSLILFSLSHWYALSVILLVPVGFAMMTQMGASNTMVQAMVPDRLRGRTMAVYAMMFMGMAPLGALLSGGVAQRIGAPWTVGLGGTLTLAGAIAFGRYLPRIRVEARQLIVAQGMVAGEPTQGITARIVS
ncbi:MAG TPA: MFS transporter [Candidatus Acidoferrales bacterium]|nr:MFS transporter [Candidatus Acidoferrales bacterium]